MSLLDVERAVLGLCFEAEPSAAHLAELGDPDLWLLYREMVRGRLRKELRVALPRTRRALGEQVVERAFVRHLALQPPRSRFFRDFVPAFVASALLDWRDDPTLPAFACDLLAYEAVLWQVADLDARVSVPVVDFSFDRVPVVSPALQIIALRHAVHRRLNHEGGYAAGEFWLGVHRPGDNQKPRTWRFDRATFALLQAWQQGDQTVSVSLQRVSETQGFALDAAFVDRFCTMLAALIDAGIVLGSR
jgi:hypothetical protein